ncbi:hypothetical protein TVAG_224120 [Trichomonas vaginalis G3]|uniref:Intimal thickness related receptor IRP domain-containing protein n=1 Tax=Trichomonas vaginalis (strain ATCC PRA-98 / G3) TaxID=412133 RepID=A2DW35_TRIV3|nr:lung seven transmembrane receptor family [Trichomonas vaginalis G3]EAY15336.1 hypothetical protein TVAG_224120 [Trichomonas vaginalis G3]KAI5496801.1 lung seven transmembrane receptor family [Trichomonas vaginalis G3]|eukprot:XP_001327559.1 hypothetical protein [Trichomonas vaginalis G3]
MFAYLLFFRSTLVARTSYNTIVPYKWGFQKGGNLTAHFTEVEARSIVLSLCDPSEYKSLQSGYYISCESFATLCQVSQLESVQNKEVKFNLTVPKRSTYYTVIGSCNSLTSEYRAELVYSNPNTKLSTELIPCLYTKPIMVGLFGIVIIFWYINWFMNFSGSSILHKFYTVAFTLALVNIIIDTLYYYHYSKSDINNGITQTSVVFSFLFLTLVVICYAFVAKGYGVLHDNYSYLDVFKVAILSAVMIGAVYAYRYAGPFWLALFLFVIFGISLYFFIKMILTGTNNSLLHVFAHMYVIAERGINPFTTPLKRKLRIYKTVNYIIMVYLCLSVFLSLFFRIIGIPEWIFQLLNDILNLALVCGAVYLFKLEKSHSGYQAITETLEAQEFTREDIRNLDFDAAFARATEEWDGQTLLPPMPRIVETPTIRQQDNEEVDVQPRTEEPYDIEVQAPDVTPSINPYLDDVDPAARP